MTASIKMRAHVTGAVLAAFVLRLYFVCRFPFYDAGDTPIYQQLAHNWLRHGIYGLEIFGRVTPVDIRTPGYPAFLASIYTVFGENARAVMVMQAFVGVLTCVLVAAMAAVLAPKESRRRVALAALWLAALCPFTANYTAVVLTETLTIFLSALALLVLMEALRGLRRTRGFVGLFVSSTETSSHMQWLMGGIVVGFGTLVRPETPLILAAGGA
ncbi:MAG: glycosyltransferase family 39 protein, partial [Candidatus Acidiferrales bacterium]